MIPGHSDEGLRPKAARRQSPTLEKLAILVHPRNESTRGRADIDDYERIGKYKHPRIDSASMSESPSFLNAPRPRPPTEGRKVDPSEPPYYPSETRGRRDTDDYA